MNKTAREVLEQSICYADQSAMSLRKRQQELREQADALEDFAREHENKADELRQALSTEESE